MNPPAGRLKIGDRVLLPGSRRGTIVGEALLATNGAWRYDVRLDDGGTVQHLDFELRLAT